MVPQVLLYMILSHGTVDQFSPWSPPWIHPTVQLHTSFVSGTACVVIVVGVACISVCPVSRQTAAWEQTPHPDHSRCFTHTWWTSEWPSEKQCFQSGQQSRIKMKRGLQERGTKGLGRGGNSKFSLLRKGVHMWVSLTSVIAITQGKIKTWLNKEASSKYCMNESACRNH